MKITKEVVLEGDEPLSRALNEIVESGTAVIITKNGRYYGVIDDRHLRHNIVDASRIRCDSVSITAPTLSENISPIEKINFFLTGHFKALALINKKQQPIGLFTRSDLIEDLLTAGIMPKIPVNTVMSSPVISIEENEGIGKARSLMKENDINKLVVTKQGRPYTIISKFDLASFALAPKKRKERKVVSQIMSADKRKVMDLQLRGDVGTVSDSASIHEAAEKMMKRKISTVIVLSDHKAVGILTARDIFRKIKEILNEMKEWIGISGLHEENAQYYPLAKDKIRSAINKFSKALNVHTASVHFKKKKNLYIAKALVHLDNGSVAVGYEDYNVKNVINGLARELETILEKKKEIIKYKKGRRED